jgi:hypothetical protein
MKTITRTIAVAAVAFAAVAGLTGCTPTSPDNPCTVTDKDRSTDSSGNSIYRVYTEGGDGCGVFNVEDAAAVGQFASADTYASIKVGKTYQFETYGYRNPFFSMFPNITKATEVAATGSDQ